MNTKLFLIILLFHTCIYAQVGIGTNSPQVTLQVNGIPSDATKADGIMAPQLTRSQLNAKQSSYTSAQNGAIVFITDVIGATNPSIAGIKRSGYYFFNGTTWKSLDPSAGTVMFAASLGSGDGGATNATITQTAFNTVRLPNVASNIGGGTWDNTNYIYTIPVSGTYLIKSSIRLIDGSVSRNVFQAVHTSNVDTPEGLWQTNTGNRWTMLYNRIAYFNSGDQLRLYIYSDGQEARLSDASLNITMITIN